MRIHLIIIALLISAASASSQNAHINIKKPGSGSGHVVYQRLDKYSFVDSVALDGMGIATIDVECDEEYQFFRLILGQQKLPMILQKGENATVELDTNDILKSKLSGSPETEYLLASARGRYNPGSVRKMIKKNPERIANLFMVEWLDFGKDFDIIKGVAERFAQCNLPAAVDLRDRVGTMQLTRPGSHVPHFRIVGRDGNVLDINDYQGKRFTIFFWAPWNTQSAKKLDEYKKSHPGLPVMEIPLDENFGYFSNDAARIFRVASLPMIIEVDDNGRIL